MPERNYSLSLGESKLRIPSYTARIWFEEKPATQPVKAMMTLTQDFRVETTFTYAEMK
jgi:hypothetical protein